QRRDSCDRIPDGRQRLETSQASPSPGSGGKIAPPEYYGLATPQRIRETLMNRSRALLPAAVLASLSLTVAPAFAQHGGAHARSSGASGGRATAVPRTVAPSRSYSIPSRTYGPSARSYGGPVRGYR